jgi:hypothetical protein
VRKRLRLQSKDFYAAGSDVRAKRWNKCISVGGGYVVFFFQFRISQVLGFIYNCDLFNDSPSYLNGKLVHTAVDREAVGNRQELIVTL